MNIRSCMLALMAALSGGVAFGEEAAPPSEFRSQWTDLPVKKAGYREAPAGWIRTEVAARGISFAMPCEPQEKRVQEELFEVIALSCSVDELLYVIIIGPLDHPQIHATMRAHWAEIFITRALDRMREQAAKRGADLVVTPRHRVEYLGTSGGQLTIEVSGRAGTFRALTGKKTGVMMQVLSRGPGMEQAERFFDSLKFE